MSDEPYDLDAEMRRAGLTQADILRLAGATERTFFRWKRDGVPAAVATIIGQQIRIRALQARLAAAESVALAEPRETHSQT